MGQGADFRALMKSCVSAEGSSNTKLLKFRGSCWWQRAAPATSKLLRGSLTIDCGAIVERHFADNVGLTLGIISLVRIGPLQCRKYACGGARIFLPNADVSAAVICAIRCDRKLVAALPN
jgi:hypothetical protein